MLKLGLLPLLRHGSGIRLLGGAKGVHREIKNNKSASGALSMFMAFSAVYFCANLWRGHLNFGFSSLFCCSLWVGGRGACMSEVCLGTVILLMVYKHHLASSKAKFVKHTYFIYIYIKSPNNTYRGFVQGLRKSIRVRRFWRCFFP